MATGGDVFSSALLDLLFDDDTVGRCLVAPDGTILRTNAEWRRSTGYSAAEVLGADLIGLFPTTRDMALAMHARARAGHRVEMPRHMQRIRGIETWWEGRIEPVAMERGTGLLITTREVDAPAAQARRPHSATELADYLRDVGPAGIVLFEPAPPFRVLSTNEAYLQLWPEPLRSRGLVGLALTDFIRDAEEAGVAEVFRDVARTRVTRHLEEFPYPLADGEHWFNWTLVPVVRGGELVALANMAVDITREVRARKEAERARDESRRGAELLELGDALCELDRDYRVVRVNARQEELTGVPRAASLGKTHWELWPETGKPDSPWWIEYHRCMEERVPVQFENYYAPLALWSNVTVYPTSAGGIAIFFRDVTARRRAEEALRDSDAKLRSVFEQAAVGMGRVNFADARWVDVNDAFCRMLGRSRDELLRTPWPEITHPEDVELDLVPFRRMAAGELDSYSVEKRFLHGDGHHVWARLTLSLVRDAAGRPDYEIAIIEDITRRKRSEAALEAERMRWRGVVEGIAEEVWVCDADGRMTLINLPDRTTMGLSEFQGKTYAEVVEMVEILTPDGAPRPLEEAPLLRSLRTGEILRGEEIMRHRESGLERRRQYSCAPTRDPGGAITGAVAIVRDVTAQRDAEAALRALNERLLQEDRRKNDFLGMLSHELRNPLAPIRNAIFLLRHAGQGTERAARAQAVIERQTEHLTRLVDDLLDVTRIARGKIELRRSCVDLREVVSRAAEDFRLVMQDRGVTFDVRLPAEQLWADADPTRITQVVGNLIHNASKFTRRGDGVTLTLAREGGTGVITVRDTGAGIVPALLPSIFDPFIQGDRTLARTEGGLGLGLALVKGIAELHGGTVHADSAGEGRGAEFVVALPLLESARSDGPSRDRPRGRGDARRVLVVDDNRDAAETLAELVAVMGHTVAVAFDGPSAIERVRSDRPELVLCDLGLPGMSGYDVGRRIRELCGPAVRLVAVSGYAQPEDVRRSIEAGFDAHMAKPLDPGLVERLLAGE